LSKRGWGPCPPGELRRLADRLARRRLRRRALAAALAAAVGLAAAVSGRWLAGAVDSFGTGHGATAGGAAGSCPR
jgi:hypothetical protein